MEWPKDLPPIRIFLWIITIAIVGVKVAISVPRDYFAPLVPLFRRCRRTDRVEELQKLCAALYQFAGEVGAPERVLDVLAAAQRGERLSEEAIDAILPITADECDPFTGQADVAAIIDAKFREWMDIEDQHLGCAIDEGVLFCCQWNGRQPCGRCAELERAVRKLLNETINEAVKAG